MKVLVACEFSGIVREAFRKKGHEAYSCDLLPTEIKSDYHIQMDILELIYKEKFKADLMIAHPDCTYLTNSGVRWLHTDPTRWKKLYEGTSFFNLLKDAPYKKIAIENPIPHKYAKKQIGDYTQIIQPYQFGHLETKATCLWLKNLPELVPTNNVYEEMKKLPKNQTNKVHYEPKGPDRWKNRSRTKTGIAQAMADQWG